MRRVGAGGFVTVIVVMTACSHRHPRELDAMRLESAMSAIPARDVTPSWAVSANRIARTELLSVSATNLADAIMRLRPAWVRATAPDPLIHISDPVVYVDETFVGGLNELRMIALERVGGVEHLTPSSGFARFGRRCRCNGGLILVRSRER